MEINSPSLFQNCPSKTLQKARQIPFSYNNIKLDPAVQVAWANSRPGSGSHQAGLLCSQHPAVQVAWANSRPGWGSLVILLDCGSPFFSKKKVLHPKEKGCLASLDALQTSDDPSSNLGPGPLLFYALARAGQPSTFGVGRARPSFLLHLSLGPGNPPPSA